MTTRASINFGADVIAFTLPGEETEYKLDIARAMHELDAIGKRVPEDEPIAYVELFQQWITETTGAKVSYSQAYSLVPMVNEAFNEFKKKLPSLRTSATTTDSTPRD